MPLLRRRRVVCGEHTAVLVSAVILGIVEALTVVATVRYDVIRRLSVVVIESGFASWVSKCFVMTVVFEGNLLA